MSKEIFQRPEDLHPTTPIRFIFERMNKRELPEGFDFDNSYNDYQKFLYLHHLYPEEKFPPNYNTDLLWHCHMKDPENYFQDCMKWFGKILGHDQTLVFSDEGRTKLKQMSELTREKWKLHFNEEYIYERPTKTKTKNNVEGQNEKTEWNDDGFYCG